MDSQSEFSEKVIMIVGASSGIGEKIALYSAKKGASLILLARREERLVELRKRCEQYTQAPVFIIQLDISQPEQIERAVKEVFSIVDKVDYLVNSAGYGETGKFVEQSFNTIERIFSVNVLGLMYLTQLVAIEMIEQKEGHIINIGSMAGKIATPQSAIYSASKHAIVGFSNSLRLELKEYNIKLTTVNTGPVETEFFIHFDPTGDYKKAMQPFILSPDLVAKKTIKILGKNKREINLPFYLNIAHKFYVLFPSLGDTLANTVFNLK
ncbi:SDR family NAD(P)-dependent oxidoreductase [Lacticigenium naphthae]|uniref:SDR family NAD(P)-dependent oxidoreductase n=1 Tax=Lacticigenium naphthae TaxID=515351 RepID=UPI000416A769|nr:SDR family oxidoreductase [Lacticigenium naphthae]